MKRPITIFYVYAETDEALRQQLEKHLTLLQRQGVLASWQESQAGALWEQEREQSFNEASLILLLVSADFLASDVCYQELMLRALERQKQGEVQVLPILVRPVDVTNAPFTHLPMVPTSGKAVTLWVNQDAAWTHITEGIRCVLEGKPLPVVGEEKPEARYSAENQQTVYGQTIGEHNEIHHHYPPVSPPPAPAAASVEPIWMVPSPRNPFSTGIHWVENNRRILVALAFVVIIVIVLFVSYINSRTLTDIYDVPANQKPPGIVVSSLSYGAKITISAASANRAYYGDNNSGSPPCVGSAWTDPSGRQYVYGNPCGFRSDPNATLPSAPIGALLYGLVCDNDVSHIVWLPAFEQQQSSTNTNMSTSFTLPGPLNCPLPHQIKLYLLYNDAGIDAYKNNQGKYQVTVQITS